MRPPESSAWVGTPNDEALPLLLTLSSGVTGFTTIHAGSARQALTRLRFVCQLADTSGGLPLAALNTLVSESVDVVVHCTRAAAGPRVTEVVLVEDLQGGLDAAQFTLTEVFRGAGPDQPLAWTGNLPVRAVRALADAGHDIRRLLDDRPILGGHGPRDGRGAVVG
jgi:pilus assembly protein CpaF